MEPSIHVRPPPSLQLNEAPLNHPSSLPHPRRFDLLPVRYESHEQMEPGDLVFAEGKYVKEGVRPQKGDIVHVEIFLGGGPIGKRVCGARWGRGVVQVRRPRAHAAFMLERRPERWGCGRAPWRSLLLVRKRI